MKPNSLIALKKELEEIKQMIAELAKELNEMKRDVNRVLKGW
jgi:chromosome segregation ATPase